MTLSKKVMNIIGAAAMLVLIAGSAAAQRLCEHNDNPVAKIAPCTGPTGTAISITMFRNGIPAAQSLVFKRMVANATPAKVTLAASGGLVTTTGQLCINGPGRWEVWMIDGNGVSQGKIGAFWPDCAAPPVNNAGGGGAGGNNAGSGGNVNGKGGGGGAGPKGGNGVAGAIDPCLVGRWEALVPATGKMQGGKGLRLSFKADGMQTSDFTAMQPFLMSDWVYQYTGTSTGRTSTSGNAAATSRISDNATVEIRVPGMPAPAKPTKGFLLGVNKNDNSYTCSSTTLTFGYEDYQGKPWVKFTMQKLR